MARDKKTSDKDGGLDQSPSHLMHRALQLALDIYGEAHGPDGLTQRQFAVLETVSRQPGLTQSDLVKATGIDRSTLADLVSRMTTKGLLKRARSPIDARAMTVDLSEAGHQALVEARPKVASVDKRILSLLPKNKRNSFMDLLTGLAAAADAAPEQAKAEAKAAKRAAKEARKAERAAQKLKPDAQAAALKAKSNKKKKKQAPKSAPQLAPIA